MFVTPKLYALLVAAPSVFATIQSAQTPAPPSASTHQTELAAATSVAPPNLEFDVASVKISKSDDKPYMNFPLGPGDWYVPNGGNFIATNLPLILYINFAYKLTGNQVQAIQKQLPEWVITERYDIIAKTDGHDATKDAMRLMMRSLLADRFKLAIHSEQQQTQVYGLVVAKPGKLGPKLRPHTAGDTCTSSIAPPGAGGKGSGSFTVAGGFPTICGGITGMQPSTPGRRAIGARNVTMVLVASALSEMGNLGKPVLDQTGLTGKFDFLLEFAPERRPRSGDETDVAAPMDNTGPGFEEALMEQLGMKLESQKGPVDVWVVDHVEHATEN